MSAGGFGSDTDTLFREAMASLFDTTCTVSRKGPAQHVGAFNYTQALTVIYQNAPCTIQHGSGIRAMLERYAERTTGREIGTLFVAPSLILKDRDVIQISGGDTYEVIGDPHLDGPDDPALTVQVATNPPVVVNP